MECKSNDSWFEERSIGTRSFSKGTGKYRFISKKKSFPFPLLYTSKFQNFALKFCPKENLRCLRATYFCTDFIHFFIWSISQGKIGPNAFLCQVHTLKRNEKCIGNGTPLQFLKRNGTVTESNIPETFGSAPGWGWPTSQATSGWAKRRRPRTTWSGSSWGPARRTLTSWSTASVSSHWSVMIE